MDLCKIKTDGVLFDLDGTLWDSRQPASEVWARVVSEYPQITDEVSAERLGSFYGLPLEDIAKNMFKSVPYEFALAVMERCVKEQCPYLVEHNGLLLGDIRGLFEALKRKHIKVYIVSNCRAGYIEAFLKGHELEGLVDDHLCPGDTGLLKADNIMIMVKKWGLAAPVYVGDTAGDLEAAEAANVPFIFAGYGFGNAARYDAKLETPEELADITELYEH